MSGNKSNAKHANRVIRRAFNAPIAQVSSRPRVKPNAMATVSINNIRRFTAFPKRLPKAGKPNPWWIERLEWPGVIIMKLLLTTLKSFDFPISDGTQLPPEFTDPAAKPMVPTGSITTLSFSLSSLLAESDFVQQVSGTPVAKSNYRQAKLEWIKVTIHPVSHPNNRGGMVAAAINPITMKQFEDDFKNRQNEVYDFNELLKEPGVIYKTALTPTMLTYSPRPCDSAFKWQTFAFQQVLLAETTEQLFYLHFGYTNLSSNSNVTPEYALTHSMFDISVESRIHLRDYAEDVFCNLNPISIVDTDKVTVSTYNNKLSISTSNIFDYCGFYCNLQNLSEHK